MAIIQWIWEYQIFRQTHVCCLYKLWLSRTWRTGISSEFFRVFPCKFSNKLAAHRCSWFISVGLQVGRFCRRSAHQFHQFSALLIATFFKRASKALLNVVHMPKDIALKHGWDDIVQVLARLQDTCPWDWWMFWDALANHWEITLHWYSRMKSAVQ